MSSPTLAASRQAILDHLADANLQTPCLVLDVEQARINYRNLASELPAARIRYAVKACPEPRVVAALAELGAELDIASIGELDLCLDLGIGPSRLCYGNPIKKARDVARAYQAGVRQFVCDSEPDLDALIGNAPGASIEFRFLADVPASGTPFGRKFGCSPQTVGFLIRKAAAAGLDVAGPCFHVGSQQTDPQAWRVGIAQAAAIAREVAADGIAISSVNIGGGLPISYREPVSPLGSFTSAIAEAFEAEFADLPKPDVVVEPGRALAGSIGVLRTEVVLVRDDAHGRRWVFLDAGRYNGLAETENEYIAYDLRTSRDGEPVGPAVIAGPTCDGDDVIYQNTPYELPLSLRATDVIDVHDAGAYTASYASVSFNGFAPLVVDVIDSAETAARIESGE